MSEATSIPTVPVWDILGRETSGSVTFFERFRTGEEADSRLEVLEREGDDSVQYEIIRSISIVPDRTMPTERQRRELCDLIHRAFVALRSLAYERKHYVMADLADALHNLPHEMYCEESWDWNQLEAELLAFENKHGDNIAYRFSAMVREIRRDS